jgi:Holliday junction resolvasome RuvABC DNA-binding subunit
MASPTCPDCGSKDVAWGTAKTGRRMLYDTVPILHLRTCKGREKKAKAASAPAPKPGALTPEQEEAVGFLKALGYKGKGEAQRMVLDAGSEGEVGEIVERALKAQG